MAAYALDLRQRLLDAVERKDKTKREMATLFGVHESFIYSPDFNPIAECMAKIKAALRRGKARTPRKLYNALAKAIALVTENDILGWVKHCGCVFSRQ